MNYRGHYDVIVVGGGPGGLSAAIAAGRQGAKTLLVERYGFLGGMCTAAYVSPFMTTHFGDEWVTGGIVRELIERLKKVNGAIGPLLCPYDKDTTYGTGGAVTVFDVTLLRHVAFEMVEEAGVELLLHSLCIDAIKQEDRVSGILVANKSGIEAISGSVIVDATGDGDVAYLAGARYTKGDPTVGRAQPMSLMYFLGGVDVLKFREYAIENKEDFAWMTVPETSEPIPSELQQHHFACSGLYSLVEKGKESGELHTGRARLTLFSGLYPGQMTMNATRIIDLDGTNVDHLTLAEVDTRRQAVSIANFLKKYVPGFENSFILSTPAQVGVRETRQITGEYILTDVDILEGTVFPDTIAKGSFPIDIHQPDGSGNTWVDIKRPYCIPYRALVPQNVDGLLTSGRCISGTHQAMAAFRVIPICFAIGQGAGTAAALASKQGIEPRNLDVEELRDCLAANGAII